ncbi:23S rRNA (uracil(1939)-C(5))-methyltransferase RlmD [Clostridium gasigenes]|uniref:23S rRNA (uracil(1939)-C(5))-methyltransferase RlmD n=1 Tax=Clostridium gasigenes TaxID=94869 RepID=UPI001C0B44C8|nr:23S rRNA (uracil(1939)-C(5))-methyltransferase RlmD [Clostridium gasigenes]MBU3108048.1 23S rRNA (uracil(1939)-C(5))-methyltransferase RlmD [Clostridium gasigenes]
MIEKNKEYILDIVGQGYEGEGIAKVDSYPIFIQGALTGEKVKILAIKANKNFGFGKLLEIIEPSEERVTPECEHAKRCGGCSIQHMNYKNQLDFKFDRVKDCMHKIAGLTTDLVQYPIGMETPTRYRNKVQLPVGMVKGKIAIGFYATRSHNIIDINKCLIQDEIADKVAAITRSWMEKYKILPATTDGIFDPKGLVKHIMIRKGFKTDEVMVVLVTIKKTVPHINEFIANIRDNIDGIKSIVHNINSKDTNVVLGTDFRTIWGAEKITDYIDKFKFNISPVSFFQINPVQTEVLYSTALKYAALTGKETVIDAYCGTGTITLFLGQKAEKVYGVEIVPEAIENAIENAKENKIYNAEFLVGTAEEKIQELLDQGVKPDTIVVDPPRKGCDIKLLEAIAQAKPKNVVYISCDPSTLARDLKILTEKGFKVGKIQPVDMFPHTPHIECVVKLKRK